MKESSALNHRQLPNKRDAAIEVAWWQLPQSYRQLKKLAQAWPADAKLPAHHQLGPCLYEIHTARQMLQPHPYLAVALHGGELAGLLIAFTDQCQKQVVIPCTAVHPRYADTDQSLQVLEPLIYAAVDLSLACGWRGWIACAAEDAPHEALLELGFHVQPPFWYRKMGYFA